MLLEMRGSESALADERVEAEVDTIILAGQETVATALNFVFLMLGCRPDVQRKLCEERDLYHQFPGCTVHEGATCCINIWGAGRSRALWGDTAALYQPERWLSTLPSKLPSLLNFSTGKRTCIGKHYAMCLMKTIIVHRMRKLEFMSQDEKMELKIDIALRPVSGHLIQVRERISGDCIRDL